MGCSTNQEDAKAILDLLKTNQEAWNQHNIYNLTKYYVPNFQTKDKAGLETVRTNLVDFWLEYPDAKIQSLPVLIHICGNHARVHLLEKTSASENIEVQLNSSKKAYFEAWIEGDTILKKLGQKWRIVKEDISTETIWKYYGETSKEILHNGQIQMVTPPEIVQGKNYIASLKYNLPSNVKAIAFLDKTLLGNFAKEDTDVLEELNTNEEAKNEENKQRLASISRLLSNGDSSELKRLFQANPHGQDELVTAHIELIIFGKGDKESQRRYVTGGIISISKRISPVTEPQKENPKVIKDKTFAEESQEQSED